MQYPDGDEHGQIWRSGSPAGTDQREQRRRSESFLAAHPVGEPGLGDGAKCSPGGEEGIDRAQYARR
jgi:hypothetical protein